MYFTNDPKLCRLNNAVVYSLSRSASGTENIERSHRIKWVELHIHIYTHACFFCVLIIKKEGKQEEYTRKTIIRSMNYTIINKILTKYFRCQISNILLRNNKVV